MNRREALLAAGVGAAAVALKARAAGETPAAGGPPSPLIAAAFACIQVGQACQQHCLLMLSKGDTSLAECATTIAAMLPA